MLQYCALFSHIMQEQLIPPTSQMLSCGRQQLQDRRSNRPNISEEVLKCPRCDSTHTKFCYYNNYSLAQPRHYCKTCKRYWTKGGSLRNVPVGGGCRKNKRSKQRSVSLCQGPSVAASEEAILSSIRCEGASSSSPIETEFSLQSSSKVLFGDHKNSSGLDLNFNERLDQGTGGFASRRSVPLSINWAGPGSSAATLNLQSFESSILGLNLQGSHIKQETLPLQSTGNFTSMFEPQLNSVVQALPAVGDSFGSYSLLMDSLGTTSRNSDIQWRLPTPGLGIMMERGHGGRIVTQTLEDERAECMRYNRKFTFHEEMPLPNVIDMNQDIGRLPTEWQSQPEGFFDTTVDGAYWPSHGGWPQDDMYTSGHDRAG